MGILVYEYNGMLNTIEEQIFIPCNKAYAVLKADVEQLSFVNKSGILYLYLDGSILAINLPEGLLYGDCNTGTRRQFPGIPERGNAGMAEFGRCL